MIIHVSQGEGSTGATGTENDPFDTATEAIAEAEARSQLQNGHPWEVHIYGGVYNEQIKPQGPNPVPIVLHGGARIQYSGTGACVDDSAMAVHLTLMQGSEIIHANGGNALDLQNDSVITGVGQCLTDSAGLVFNVTGGNVFVYEVNHYGLGNSSELIRVSGGNLRLVGCESYQSAVQPSIVKTGGQLTIDNCRLFGNGPKYITAPTAEDVQVINSVSNVGAHANVTETVGTMLVDPNFTL